VLSSAGYVPFPTLMRIVSAHIIPYDVHTLFIHRAIYSKFVNICVGVFAEVRVSVIYTNCPSERYNQIVHRIVYIVEIVLESTNGRYISKEEGCSQA
jgi:hypothetical protein